MKSKTLLVRMAFVRMLLESRNDYLPSPQVCSVYSSAIPGVTEGKETHCETCIGLGRVLRGKRITYCPTCDGTGWRKGNSKSQSFDSYTKEYDSQKHKPPVTQIALVNVSLPDESEGFYDKARSKRDTKGSYRELETQLVWLGNHYPSLSRLLMLVYDTGIIPRKHLTKKQKLGESIAVALLARRMRGRVIVPGRQYKEWKRIRNGSSGH